MKSIQLRINNWFDDQAEKVKLHSRLKVIQESEKVRIYRTNNRSSITKLKRPQGIIKGHKHCADLLNKEVAALLGREAELDKTAQEQLLDEVKEVFTAKDNEMLEAEISDEEVTESLRKSITFLVYDKCVLAQPGQRPVQCDQRSGQSRTPDRIHETLIHGLQPKAWEDFLPPPPG